MALSLTWRKFNDEFNDTFSWGSDHENTSPGCLVYVGSDEGADSEEVDNYEEENVEEREEYKKDNEKTDEEEDEEYDDTED